MENASEVRYINSLEKNSSNKEVFVISRTFKAPQKFMFDMWTDPAHFSQWLPPTGFTMTFIRSDIWKSGSCFYVMSDGIQTTMYGRVEYVEIRDPHRIVYTQQFCDEKENISRHPHAPTWPETMLTTVDFASESPCETRVTVTWTVHGDATREEIAAFCAERGGMTQGWTGSFDKLESYLGSR